MRVFWGWGRKGVRPVGIYALGSSRGIGMAWVGWWVGEEGKEGIDGSYFVSL